MSLLDFAKQNIAPTADQEKAFQALDDFLKSEGKCFLLKGYAGTGKTTIIKTIAEYISQQKQNPVLLAPTGRAARILSNKTSFEANTIHRGIYNLNELDEIEIKRDGKKQYKFRFNLLEVKSNITQIYLIDEASMISDRQSEQDFFVFGSGVLLKDIMHFIGLRNKARKDKIIFIGDPAQLPPVSDSISGALSKTYLKEKYKLETHEYELTQVVRQAQESGILNMASYLRKRLKPDENTSTFKINENYPDIQVLKPEVIAEQYKKQNPELKVNQTAIINFSNKSALEYNLLVRDTFFNHRHQIQAGDLLMINQNNYNYEISLYNGTMVKVVKVSPVPLLRSNIKSYDQNGVECKVNLKFRNITIEVSSETGKQLIDCLILDGFLYSRNPQLDYEEHIALYLDFKFRHRNLKPKTQAFKDTLRTDPYFNALCVKYGYAITCHKAQGGEWESVMVNLDLGLGRQSAAFNRWLYTAVTRAQKMLYLFNYQRITHFSKLDFSCSYLPEENRNFNETSCIAFQLPTDLEDLYVQFRLGPEEFFKREKFKELLARADHFGYNILARQTHNYQKQYTFEKEDKTATLVFWYNGKNKFGRITIFNNPSQDIHYSKKLLADFTIPLEIIFEETGVPQPADRPMEETKHYKAVVFPDEYENLSVLYDNLKELLKEKNIRIYEIDHGQYNERYTFIRKGEEAVVQFHYNNKNLFTQAGNLLKKCNSNTLLQDIETAITKLKEEN